SSSVLVAKLVSAVLVALPAIVLVCSVAHFVKNVQLTAGQWGVLTAEMSLGSLAFASVGLAIGYLAAAEVAFALTYGVYIGLSAVGGLFVPPAVLPAGIQDWAHLLPSYRLAELGWRVASGQPIDGSGLLVLICWAVIAAGVAWSAIRRPRLRTRRAG
ncbi:MAG: ABC transporter permease, partial [Acidobacteria bacterium]|nr:ABC transporter permease [Acidobacteriota bacterium]